MLSFFFLDKEKKNAFKLILGSFLIGSRLPLPHVSLMKLVKIAVKIANLEKAIAKKSAKLSFLTSQKNSIMLPLPTNGGSSSTENFGGLLD